MRFTRLVCFSPGNISKNCTADGWSDVFPAVASVCGSEERPDKVCVPRGKQDGSGVGVKRDGGVHCQCDHSEETLSASR